MRILALTVAKNEASRYLEDFLEWTSSFVDEHFVYDDGSHDATVAIASQYAVVRQRPEDVPDFLLHEGIFRQSAYQAMLEDLVPQDGDWILSLDCDEFLVAHDERTALEDLSLLAEINGKNGVTFPVIEIFGRLEDQRLGLRTDGYWNTITATRFFAFEDGAEFPDKPMGGGSVPTYVNAFVPDEPAASLLHVGYLREEERMSKYMRYSTRSNNGHNAGHIRSILSTPRLEAWPGKVPACLQ